MQPTPPPADPLAERLERCYTGAVYDVLRGLGLPNQALPADIRPLVPSTKLAGRIFTVSGHAQPNLDAHESLLHWTAFLSRAPAGSVVLCQPNDASFAHMGELSAETLNFRGVRGYLVDGGCRDTEFIVELGFRVFCRYVTPIDVVGRWKAETFGDPISIGVVTIRTGDYVLADRDGAVVIPGEIVEEVVSKTEAVMNTENEVRTAIMRGVDPQQAYLQYGKF
ncbi:MAG: RraA family protein [Candidatus Didemnitutus sp.]|nr:RraA family protein [Candidatus Didemnitutus sp.]